MLRTILRAGLLGRLRAGQVWGSLVPLYVLHGGRHARGGLGVGSPVGRTTRDHWNWNGDWGGGGGGGWAFFILLYLFIFSGIPVIITAIIACICVRCGCCKSCLPPKLVYKDLGRQAANGAERGGTDRARDDRERRTSPRFEAAIACCTSSTPRFVAPSRGRLWSTRSPPRRAIGLPRRPRFSFCNFITTNEPARCDQEAHAAREQDRVSTIEPCGCTPAARAF